MKTLEKITSIALICFIICMFIPADVNAAPANAVRVFINNEEIHFTESGGTPFIDANGRTMLPVRACLDAIGASVEWEPQTRVVITQKGNVTIKIPVGSNEIIVNGNTIKTDAAAIILNSRTYLPLRAVLEAYGYAVDWDPYSRVVRATELTPFNINGGITGIFQRLQLPFSGFDGIRADITVPFVPELEKGDCPYVYFGFDWENDAGNVEGGFQFIEDPAHPHYNEWTVFMRQGDEWRWGNNIFIEQGATRNLSFYAEYIAEGHTDLVIELDGREVIRKKSAVGNFESASVKTVISMAMTKEFDGQNCFSKSIGARVANVEVRAFGSANYADFSGHPLYSSWRPHVGAHGMWYGTSICVPAYIHFEADGKISIYLK